MVPIYLQYLYTSTMSFCLLYIYLSVYHKYLATVSIPFKKYIPRSILLCVSLSLYIHCYSSLFFIFFPMYCTVYFSFWRNDLMLPCKIVKQAKRAAPLFCLFRIRFSKLFAECFTKRFAKHFVKRFMKHFAKKWQNREASDH